MPIFTRKNGVSIKYNIIDKNEKFYLNEERKKHELDLFKTDSNKTAPFSEDKNNICLLLGGLTRDHTIWRKIVPELSSKFKLIVLDNRDSGESSSNFLEYDISDMADDISDLINELKIEKLNLIGHSMGGFIAIHVAANNPEIVENLILCSTAEKQVPEAIKYLNNRIELMNKKSDEPLSTANESDILSVMDKIYSPESLKNVDFVNEIIRHETKNPYPQSAESFIRQAKACILHDASKILYKIKSRTLVLTGDYDRYYTAEVSKNLSSKIESSEFYVIKNSGHIIQLEQPKELSKIISNFLI